MITHLIFCLGLLIIGLFMMFTHVFVVDIAEDVSAVYDRKFWWTKFEKKVELV